MTDLLYYIKRLEQENNRLSTIIKGCGIDEKDGDDDTACEFCGVNKAYKALKQENEELKEKVNSYNCSANCYKTNNYRKALEEIREIASETLDIIVENDEVLGYIGSIYNKINEVLE